jgi:DNA helicase-2/ATP-dependent DNA helicase PcrA
LVQLNSTQQEAVLHIDGPLLVLAGAGSGKTRIVTERIIHLIEKGVAPGQILALTFTNKAAREMQERVRRKCASDVLISTFHSLGVRILRESAEVLGLPTNFTIYDEEDSMKLLRSCLDDLGIKDKENLKSFRQGISSAKNQLFLPEQGDKNLTPIYRRYSEKLKECGAVDFDDLIFLTARLFMEHPAELLKYQERWPYLLIDEYQDTNQAQYLIAKQLVAKNNNIFAVGDPDQSIYSWRGANIRNILNFQHDFKGAPVVRLEQNYRSRSTILQAANAVIQNNSSRLEKNLWSERGPGPKIELYIADEERQEAQFVSGRIEKYYGRIPFKEMVIFYRTNFQSRAFEDALLRKGIPYTIVGGISFYQRKEIKDILCFLRLIQSDADMVSFLRTINIPKRGFGETTLEKIMEAAQVIGEPILQVLPYLEVKMNAKQKEALKEYLDIMAYLKELNRDPGTTLDHLIKETVRKTRYFDHLLEDKESFEDRKANVDELVAKAGEWNTYHENPTLTGFLEELSLKSQLDELSDVDDRVSLMTMHNGKGLEFDLAFIVGMEEELFPHANSRNETDGLEEERRLCYVGITRAKEQLILSAARSRFLWGTWRMMRPSRFLNEIPKEFIQLVKN